MPPVFSLPPLAPDRDPPRPDNLSFLQVIESIDTIDHIDDVDRVMRRLMREGQAELPSPGQGATAERWKCLANVAAFDLSLAKIYESHADAQAILRELGAPVDEASLRAVWAAENPASPLIFDPATTRLTGTKQWCSGAAIVDEAILTAETSDGARVLVRTPMRQDQILILPSEWANAGIAAAATTTVKFRGATATPVGPEDAYLERPGFWQGGAGIAAVWYGGATAIAAHLAAARRIPRDPHGAAHLGAVFAHLRAARALLIETAAWIDEHPAADAAVPAMAVRAAVELAATETLRRAGRALGATPLCVNRNYAKRAADLEIYLRQSHAERDLACLGEIVTEGKEIWQW